MAGLVDDLQPTSPAIAGLTADNLRVIVTDMGLTPGWVSSARLYAWYASMAREVGLEPLTQNAFGRALTGLGYRRSIRRMDGVLTRCRFISARAMRGQELSRG